MDELWRDIEGYGGLYKVSNKGRVKSYHRECLIMKPYDTSTGYWVVDLHKDKKGMSFKVHRLVAKAFLSNPDNLPIINHKDEDGFNNNVDNLEWCTTQYNMEYSFSKYYEVLTPDGFLVDVFNMASFCKERGLCSSHMCNVAKGNLNQHKGYKAWYKG